MAKNKVLNEVLSKLPKNSVISYVQKPNKTMNIPYTLTVRDYSTFYLNSHQLADLTENEQLILIHSTNNNPVITPSKTIAAIFKAREIRKHCANDSDAINRCYELLLEENHNIFKAKSLVDDTISQKITYANKLEYYLNNEEEMKRYKNAQASKFSFFINIKNRLLETITKQTYTKPPVSDKELKEGKKAWKNFRKEQNAPEEMSNHELLEQFRNKYNGLYRQRGAYIFKFSVMDDLAEEYSITNLALQILDGSALQAAEEAITKNPRPYLQQFKTAKKILENR